MNLIWYAYNGQLPCQRNKGSYWWKDIVKLLNNYKGIAQTHMVSGKNIDFWNELWNGEIMVLSYPELHSFAKKTKVSL